MSRNLVSPALATCYRRLLPSFVLGLCLLACGRLHAQVVDESTPQDSIWVGVGADSADFVGQDFYASVKRVRKIGVWLRALSGTGEVRLALMKDNGNNQPNFNFILHESTLIAPDTAGGWVWDSTFSAALTVGEKYWVVIDGYNNLIGTGYSAVGTSNTFTSSTGPLRWSSDGGLNWPSVQGLPMAIHVEGDNCSFPLSISPVQPQICPGGLVTFGVPSGFVSYIWGSGQTSSTITVSNPGIYSVTAIDAANCTSVAAVNAIPGTIPYTSFQDNYEICAGTQLEQAVLPFYSSYIWSDGQTGNVDTITTSGIYWVSITSNSGCVTVDTFEVYVRPFATLDLGRDTTMCNGDTVFLDIGTGYATYLWSTGNLGPRDTIVSNTDAWVIVTDTAACITYSDTIVYEFAPRPGRPIIQILDEGLHSSFANTYTWEYNGQVLAGQTSQDVLDPVPGVYSVIVGNAFGCTAQSDTVRVIDETVGDFVSGGFSPNGDGRNETFFVEGISRYPDIQLQVFSRWGEEVYRARPYKNDWDGRSKGGGELPVGDYLYILEFGAGRATMKGTVILSR
jgi:gliding motility-associated-like protein